MLDFLILQFFCCVVPSSGGTFHKDKHPSIGQGRLNKVLGMNLGNSKAMIFLVRYCHSNCQDPQFLMRNELQSQLKNLSSAIQ